MKFTDIIDLAKAGYKPSDIKELMSLKEPETVETPAEEPVAGDNAPEVTPQETKADETVKEPDIDYKSLYEAEKSKVEKMQAENASKTVGQRVEKKSEYEILSSLYDNLY